jgi:S1-C subfamily serine protease
VTLGVVPDYGESTEGMKIGGVRPSGPAEKGGLKPGDVIVKMAGKKIMNIYDYMGLLGELKPGDRVPVEVNRGGIVMQFTVELEKRK